MTTDHKAPPVSVRRLDAKIDAFLDVLFTNGLGETADRLVLVQDVPGGKYRDLGGWGRKVIRVKLRALLNEVVGELEKALRNETEQHGCNKYGTECGVRQESQAALAALNEVAP